MLPDSRRLEGVIHSDGIAQLLDIGAQPHTHCQTAADMQASPTVTASLSCDIDTRAATPALPDSRRLEASSTATESLSCWTTRAAMPALLHMDTQREPLRGE